MHPSQPSSSPESSQMLNPAKQALVERCLRSWIPMDRMMEFQEDRTLLSSLPPEARREIFMDFAERDPEETLRFSFLYARESFKSEVLELSAKGAPEIAAEQVMGKHQNSRFLHQVLIREFGKDGADEYLKQAQVTLDRVAITKIFVSPLIGFDRIIRKLFN